MNHAAFDVHTYISQQKNVYIRMKLSHLENTIEVYSNKEKINLNKFELKLLYYIPTP